MIAKGYALAEKSDYDKLAVTYAKLSLLNYALFAMQLFHFTQMPAKSVKQRA